MSLSGVVRNPLHAAAPALPLAPGRLHAIMPYAPQKFLSALNAAMARYSINTAKRVAGFLAQLAVESNELRHTHELWSGKKDFQLPGSARAAHTSTSKEAYFEYWYGNRPDLGNLTAEDGYTYRGRGAIQITGRANYKLVGLGIGQPLEANPDLLETNDNIDMLASAYFFAVVKGLNAIADTMAPKDNASVVSVNAQLTRGVNGGHNGQAERLAYFKKGLATLGA